LAHKRPTFVVVRDRGEVRLAVAKDIKVHVDDHPDAEQQHRYGQVTVHLVNIILQEARDVACLSHGLLNGLVKRNVPFFRSHRMLGVLGALAWRFRHVSGLPFSSELQGSMAHDLLPLNKMALTHPWQFRLKSLACVHPDKKRLTSRMPSYALFPIATAEKR
jgi:hypothetical protein